MSKAELVADLTNFYCSYNTFASKFDAPPPSQPNEQAPVDGDSSATVLIDDNKPDETPKANNGNRKKAAAEVPKVVVDLAGKKFNLLLLKMLLSRNDSDPIEETFSTWMSQLANQLKTDGQIVLKSEDEILLFLRSVALMHVNNLEADIADLRENIEDVDDEEDEKAKKTKKTAAAGESDGDTDELEEDEEEEVVPTQMTPKVKRDISQLLASASLTPDDDNLELMDDIRDAVVGFHMEDDESEPEEDGPGEMEVASVPEKKKQPGPASKTMPKGVRRGVTKAGRLTKAEKRRRGNMKRDLQLARQFNALYNRRRYKLRSTLRKAPSLRSTVFRCRRCDYWAYQKHALRRHRVTYNH